jgi:CO/xanthine dehydrogenase FAD-binding subunit
MKPAKFEYLCPATLSEAVDYLSEYGEEAKILSGGQSLIPLMNMRLSTPGYLIDLGRLKELQYIREENNEIVIGATTRHIDVEKSPLVKERCPLLHQAIQYVGHLQIRHRGTIGGSIAHADPSAELPCVLSALRGTIVIASSDGEQEVSPEEFFLTYLLTSLEPTEMVKEVRFPCLSPTSGYAFVEKARRHGDFGMVEVAAVLDFDDEGTISFARLSLGGANPVPCVPEEIEEFLIGKKPTGELFHEASENVKEFIDPESDIHGSADYRRHLASVLTKRALTTAADQALGGVYA